MDSLLTEMMGGEPDRNHFDLICVAYDPTSMVESVLRGVIRDPERRLKLVNYSEMPDFYEKSAPYFLDISDFRPRSRLDAGKVAVLEKERNVYEMLRSDYGLTISEAVRLGALGDLTRRQNEVFMSETRKRD